MKKIMVIKKIIKMKIETKQKSKDTRIKNKDSFRDYEIIKGKMDDVFLNATGNDLEVSNEKNN